MCVYTSTPILCVLNHSALSSRAFDPLLSALRVLTFSCGPEEASGVPVEASDC